MNPFSNFTSKEPARRSVEARSRIPYRMAVLSRAQANLDWALYRSIPEARQSEAVPIAAVEHPAANVSSEVLGSQALHVAGQALAVDELRFQRIYSDIERAHMEGVGNEPVA